MKNYYDQLNELKIAYARLNSLEEKKKIYFEMTQPKGATGMSASVSGTVNDIFGTYVSKIELIEADIKSVTDEIKTLNENLNAMEICLRKMNGSLEKIFVLRYIDGLSVDQICKKLNYSPAHVYRKLNVIKNFLNCER